MATMTSRHTNRRSTLTALSATGRSRRVPVKIREPYPDSSEYRVGSFHLPTPRASAVPMSFSSNGTHE